MRTLGLAFATLFALGCGPTQLPATGVNLAPLTLHAWSFPYILDGTPLTVTGTGFLPEELGTQQLRLQSETVDVTVPLQFVDESTVRYEVDSQLTSLLPTGNTPFTGYATVIRTLSEDGSQSTASIEIQFELVDNLVPEITGVEPDEVGVYPGDTIAVLGQNFLLKGEGHTVMVLEGTFETLVPPETRPVQVVLPMTGVSRERLELTLTPDVLGVRPGVFKGGLSVANESKENRRDGTGLPFVVREMRRPRIDEVNPAIAARGQRILVSGRGFIGTDAFFGATTLIRIEGEFLASGASQPAPLAGPTALALFPDAFYGNSSMEYILRVARSPSGELTGLGLNPGVFTGTISPMLIDGPETILGTGRQFQMTIAPQKQIIWIQFLPGFSQVMGEMGLALVEKDIKQRVLDVCHRDYTGVNVEFRDSHPNDFIEYSVIEVGGPDPNGVGLFGLDNTAGKDVGNLRFNDVVGGANAETREQGYYAFGGVFVKSFWALSPSIPGVESLPIASPHFDAAFGPFMPALGGRAIQPKDLGGARQPQIEEVIRVLGNLIGNTVVHEIGHSLGLANIEGQFHNTGDNDGWIMDSGNFRPFVERAELDGTGPGEWSPNNRAYLERILPVE